MKIITCTQNEWLSFHGLAVVRFYRVRFTSAELLGNNTNKNVGSVFTRLRKHAPQINLCFLFPVAFLFPRFQYFVERPPLISASLPTFSYFHRVFPGFLLRRYFLPSPSLSFCQLASHVADAISIAPRIFFSCALLLQKH